MWSPDLLQPSCEQEEAHGETGRGEGWTNAVTSWWYGAAVVSPWRLLPCLQVFSCMGKCILSLSRLIWIVAVGSQKLFHWHRLVTEHPWSQAVAYTAKENILCQPSKLCCSSEILLSPCDVSLSPPPGSKSPHNQNFFVVIDSLGRVSLCSPSWHQTLHPPPSASQELGLQMCTTTLDYTIKFWPKYSTPLGYKYNQSRPIRCSLGLLPESFKKDVFFLLQFYKYKGNCRLRAAQRPSCLTLSMARDLRTKPNNCEGSKRQKWLCLR
jgi:hypothetical protein